MSYDYYGRLEKMGGTLNNPYTHEGWRKVQDYWGDRDIGEPFVQQITPVAKGGIAGMFGGLTDDPNEILMLGGDLPNPNSINSTITGLHPYPPVVDNVVTTNTGNPPALLSSLQGLFSNNLLGGVALAFGAWRAFRTKRVNMLTLGLLVYGLYSIGWIRNLIPLDSNGKPNWMMIAVCAVLPVTASALVGGVGGIIVSILAKQLFGIGRRRFGRRFRSYGRRYTRRFRSYRRRYYRRRR